MQIANNIDLRHFYTFYRDGDQLRFAVMLNPPDELFIGDPYPIRPEMRPVLERGEIAATELYEDPHGRWISGYAPIHNSRGDIVGLLEVDKDSSEYFAAFHHYTRLTIALGLLALAVSSLLGWWVLQKLVISPVSSRE